MVVISNTRGIDAVVNGTSPSEGGVLIYNRAQCADFLAEKLSNTGKRVIAIGTDYDWGASWLRVRSEGGNIDERILLPERYNSSSTQEIVLHFAQKYGWDIFAGWGYVAENSDFIRKCEDKGIGFYGPSADLVEKLGDKTTAKKFAEERGVDVIPGSEPFSNFDGFEDAIRQMQEDYPGKPLMVKAKVGGGGRGIAEIDMRQISDRGYLMQLFHVNSNTALTSFGNPELYVETKIENPRHIECQVAVDRQGNVRTFGIRDCTVQYHNQKILEESTSSIASLELLNRIEGFSRDICEGSGYTGLATVEFLVDMDSKGQDRYPAYFMEVNTRPQVELHVTDMLYNIDLIDLMIGIHDGHALTMAQRDIQAKESWVMQMRIYAQDPRNCLAGTAGKIEEWDYDKEHLANAAENRRKLQIFTHLTSGYDEPDITTKDDAMIAKVVVSGTNHRECAGHLVKFLDDGLRYQGPQTNIPLLRAVLTDPEFLDGRYTTNFLSRAAKRFEPKNIHI